MADLITMLSAAAGVGGDYQISRSLRFNSADSAYLNRTPASAGNRKTWTWSGWVKRSALGSYQVIFSCYSASTDTGNLEIAFSSGDKLIVLGWNTTFRETAAVFRDPSAWYHVVVAMNTTLATGANRLRVYVNGVEQTYSSSSDPTQNTDYGMNQAATTRIGCPSNSVSSLFNGYQTEFFFIDGQALTPSSFGYYSPTTGVWSPLKFVGTYGTNGFYLNFSDNSNTTAATLGKDYSGNGNNWTPNNFSVTAGAGNDSLVDTPTRFGTDTGAGGEVRGNYCTWNPLSRRASSPRTVFNGNLDTTGDNNNYEAILGSIAMPGGKWYWELTVGTVNIYNQTLVGIASTLPSGLAIGYGYYSDSGQKFQGGTASSYGATFTTNDVIGVAFDADGGSITFYKNGTSQGVAFTSIPTANYFPCVNGAGITTYSANFGQRPFAHAAPSGFKALVTTNLPNPTVVQGDNYFNTVLYTGTGSSQNITGVGFQPDFVWIKERNAAADHALYDAVRGVQQQLESNTTTDETTESTGLTAFGTNGFTVGSLAQVNTSTDTYVAWNWKESTVSKFDIVTYTGNGTARTISHNLGVVPNMIIVKARTTASTDQGWPVYHSANTANPETDYLLLNTDAATADLDTVWNDTAPTSSVFSVGTNALVNANNDTYVAYLFANVAGYSAFGSYTGNGSADGPFVYTGFRPAFIMIKLSSASGDGWLMRDTKRSTYNVQNAELYANLSNAENTGSSGEWDFLSNGFKLRSTLGSRNASGATYIYMAFAENPVKFSLAR